LQTIKKEEQLKQEKKGQIYKEFKNAFPDSELIEILKKE
tara:strand:- start:10 stop:126 length:117 start_codon:yes stop_codon:yes gene_type:complete